ncbi:iron dependent repressor, metal binding and dimerization domain protein [Sphingobacterium suaedae]|uniref:Iron dependent repressor, metal binding and dimerization domain protein n=1 Tax=Sphingobacterium suaedae TaxID=1686402 RepID=A0ABW5KL87_9SPHI
MIRKHRLTAMFLVVKMGFGCEEVRHIVEKIEHIHTPVTFAKMDN